MRFPLTRGLGGFRDDFLKLLRLAQDKPFAACLPQVGLFGFARNILNLPTACRSTYGRITNNKPFIFLVSQRRRAAKKSPRPPFKGESRELNFN